MANVIRLVNGGSIQVRTGVIQGIGPQGPRGVAGPQGMQGEQGPQGEVGPLGQILQMQGRTDVATMNPLTAGSDTLIAFGSVAYDDISAFTSTTNISLTQPGDYLLSCWLRFDDAGAGKRDIWFQIASNTIARKSVHAEAPGQYWLDLVFPYRSPGLEIVNVRALSSTSTNVGQGTMCVTRIGSGPVGPQGPQGIQGPIGATGAQGPQGIPGPATAGFPTYADLMPG